MGSWAPTTCWEDADGDNDDEDDDDHDDDDDLFRQVMASRGHLGSHHLLGRCETS